MQTINIAIDGPAGAGKSTIARAVAEKLGYIYVDTGALYRAVGLHALRLGIGTRDAAAVQAALADLCVQLRFVDGEQRVLLQGEDVSQAIRTPEASMAASDVSAIPAVRDFLFDLQRDIAAQNNCIMDGRDIGTVVLPKAQVKFFLSASAEERARRRHLDLLKKDPSVRYEDVLNEMNLRDANDSGRAVAPLKRAPDAIAVDTTEMDLQQSIAYILERIQQHPNTAATK